HRFPRRAHRDTQRTRHARQTTGQAAAQGRNLAGRQPPETLWRFLHRGIPQALRRRFVGQSVTTRPTQWWLRTLKKRKERMSYEQLDLSRPIEWNSIRERQAAV